MKSLINKGISLLFSPTVKNTGTVFIGIAASSFLGILFTIIAARVLDPENWGLVAAVGSLITIFVAFGDLGIGANFFQFASGRWVSHKEEVTKTYQTSFFLKIATALVGMTLVYIMSPLLSQIIFARSDTFLVLISGLGAFGILLLEFQIFAIESKKNWRAAAFISSLTNFARVAFLLILGSSNLNLVNVLIIFTGSSLVAFLLSLLWVFEPPKLEKGWTKLLRSSAGFSGWMSTNKIVSTLNSRIDILLLVSLAGAYEAGIYGAANRLAIGVPLVLGSFATVLASNYASLSGRQLTSFFKKSIALSLLIIGGLVLGILAAPYVISFLGKEYRQSAEVLQWLFVAFIPFALSTPAVNILIYHFRRPAIIAWLSIIQLPLTLFINYLYIPSLGVFAPVIAIAVTNTMTMLVSYFFALRYLKK